MSIYIVSNREVVNGKFRNDGKDKAASSSFRIAKCLEREPVNGKTVETMSYNIIDDCFPVGYENVIKALENNISSEDLKGSEYLFYDLYNSMIQSDNKKSDVLFFIHGFANSFDDNLRHIYQLKKLYMGDNSPIKHLIYLSWPTRKHKVGTYWSDQLDARETGMMVNRLYLKLFVFFSDMFEIHGKPRCRNRIHIAAHSMGNQVLKHMLYSLSEEYKKPLFGEVLLLHADVEDNVFEPTEPFINLEELSERTHIYIHRSDDALRISRVTKNFNKRLGQKGPKNRNNLNSETFIVDTSEAKDSSSRKDVIIDHWLYLYSPSVVADIIEVLKGVDEDNMQTRTRWVSEKNYFLIQ